MKIIAIRRDDAFSPNNVEKDRAILQSVADRLGAYWHVGVPMVDEAAFAARPADADIFISMGRLSSALTALECKRHRGSLVVNSPGGVARCRRSLLDMIMRNNGIAMPPREGGHGYWLKRGDGAAQSKDDVVFCPDRESLERARRAFAERGITKVVQSAHMVGDLIKFYGVGGSMFRCYYPTDDGISKFGDEKVNGTAHHYAYDREALRREVERLARLTGVAVYGGDAIIDGDGRFYIIDFNDWPSFSRCRDEAAEAIARLVIKSYRSPEDGSLEVQSKVCAK